MNKTALHRALLIGLTLLLGAPWVLAQNRTITPNYKDADITQVIEAVSDITGKNFIIDPRVRANVTMISQAPMSADEFYQTFLAILQVHGFVALPAGNVIKILPDATARQLPANDLPDRVNDSSDEFVTQVIAVKNVSAAQLVPILRPLVAQQSHLAAYPASNTLIISDHANNVARLVRIIRRIDQASDDAIDVVPLQNAAAAEIVRVTNQLFPPAAGGAEAGAASAKMVADDRTNSVLITGEKSQRLRLKTLVTYLDTPLQTGGGTQVRYLRYADAEKIAAMLKEQAPATASATGTPAPTATAGGGGSQLGKDVTILADPGTNALIITAPPKVMRSLMEVIDKLDIRRAQVLVEAIIVDVSLNKSAELGVNWAVFSDEDTTRFPAGGFIQSIGGASIIDLANAIDSPTDANPALATGTTVGIGRVSQGGVNFGAMLRALRSDDDSNIIATPHAVTMDNQEAQLQVVREVPFITGQFTNTGSTNNGQVNPFQTIQRQEVGTILKITPQINEGDAVMLKIELESSDVLPQSAVQGAVDLTTSKRTISTNVLIEDGGIVVLGGLINENFSRQESRVPFLGRIPLIGLAFKTRSGQNRKTNLMVFIRPKILRDGTQTAIETNAKYNYIREEQKKVGRREVLPILPNTKKPVLPELDDAQRKREQAVKEPAADAPKAQTKPLSDEQKPEAPPPEQQKQQQ